MIEPEERSSVSKIGFLKHDLYFQYNFGAYTNYLINKEEVEKRLEKIRNAFQLIAPKGTKFVCIVVDNKEYWCDYANLGINDYDEKWASDNLENVQEVDGIDV